jgi:beta-glucuronidase
LDHAERVAAKRDFVVGTHVWAFADFDTAQADHRPQSVNFKGYTRDRRPKLAARRLREPWRD